MGYPNGGTKGPKPGKLCVMRMVFLFFHIIWIYVGSALGYGAKAGPSNGQGAKPGKYHVIITIVKRIGDPGAQNQSSTGIFVPIANNTLYGSKL